MAPIPPRSSDQYPPLPDNGIVTLIPALRAFARTFHRDASDADDLVQETLTKALARIHQLHPGTSMRSWLFTIMRSTFHAKVKTAEREAPSTVDRASRPAIDPTQERSVHGMEISKAFQRLPEQQREVLVLIAMLGISYDEAASICGCPVGTIKSRLSRARLRLLGETSGLSSVEHTDEHPAGAVVNDTR